MKKFIAKSWGPNNFFVSNYSTSYTVKYFPEDNDKIVILMNHCDGDNIGRDSVAIEGRDSFYFSDIIHVFSLLNSAYSIGLNLSNSDLSYLHGFVDNIYNFVKV